MSEDFKISKVIKLCLLVSRRMIVMYAEWSQCITMCLHPHLQSLAHLLTVTTPAIHYRVRADISTVNLFHWLQAIIYGATLMIYHCDLQCLPSLNSRYPHNKMSKCWYNQLGDLVSRAMDMDANLRFRSVGDHLSMKYDSDTGPGEVWLTGAWDN